MKPLNWILRGVIVLGVVLLFFQEIALPLPGSKPRVIIMIDASRSMNENTKQQILRDFMKTLDSLKTRYSFRIYDFADTLKSVTSYERIKFDGATTDIGRALLKLDTKSAEAIILASDGRNNGSIDPISIRTQIPLWTYAVGQEGLPDIGIEETYVSVDTANQTNKVIQVRIRSNLNHTTETNLRVYSGENILKKISVSLVSDGLTEVSVPISVTNTITTLRLVLDSLSDEDRIDNNYRDVKVTPTRNQLKILFISGLINDDSKELLRALREVPDFLISERLELASGKIFEPERTDPDVIVVGPGLSNLSGSTTDIIINHSKKNKPVVFVNATQAPPASLFSILPFKERKNTPPVRDVSTLLSDLLLQDWEPQNNDDLSLNSAPADNAQVIYSKKNTGNIFIIRTPAKSLALEFPNIGSQIRMNRSGFRSFLEASLAYIIDPDAFPFSIQEKKSAEGYVEIILNSHASIQANEIDAWLAPDSHSLMISSYSKRKFKIEGTAPKGGYRLNIGWKGKRYLLKDKIEVLQPIVESPSRGANFQFLKQLAFNNGGHLVTRKQGLMELVSALPRRRTFHFKPIDNPLLVILIGSLLLLEIWQRRRKGLP